MSAVQVSCRLARYQMLLQWFVSPPEGTVFTPVDFCHSHLLSTVYNFLICSWNSWGEAQVRELCRLGDMIVAHYDQPLAIVDLTQDEDDQGQDELQDEDLSEPDDALDQEGDEMLFAFDHLMGDLEQSESESDAWSEFDDQDFMTSESEDSGLEL